MTVTLVTIPLVVLVAQQRQQTKSKASPSTTLAFEPVSSAIKVGEILTLNVILDPGASTTSPPNQVSFVKLSINFDPAKFTAENRCLTANNIANTLTTVLEGPICEPGKASISLSIGADPVKVVTKVTKIAVLQLKALSSTEGNNPSSITFDISTNDSTQVLSIASTDKTDENVLNNLLSTSTPALITINPAPSAPGAGPTSTPTPSPTTAPSAGNIPVAPASPQAGGAVVNAETPETIVPDVIPEIITQAPQPPSAEIILPPTGPGENILGIGVIGAILTIIGGAIFILL